MDHHSLAERLWLAVEEPENALEHDLLDFNDTMSETRVELLPGKPKIPNLVLPARSANAALVEREEDRDGSIFYTKSARIPNIQQIRTKNNEVVRSIRNASLTMTILKDKDEDWDDFQGQGQCTIGFIYSLTLRWRTVRFPGFRGGLLQQGDSPLLLSDFTQDGMRRGQEYSVVHRFAINSINYIQAKGAHLFIKETVVKIVK